MKKSLLILSAFLLSSQAIGRPLCQIYNLTVPFENINLGSGCSLQATYQFGPHGIIFCYANTKQNVGVITWPYKGVIQSGQIAIYLKTNPQFEGSFADPTGTLAIYNNQSITLPINCQFAF